MDRYLKFLLGATVTVIPTAGLTAAETEFGKFRVVVAAVMVT